ncbi:MAG: hypothetical protein LBQ12_00430 [Deltaproteobacteria bacterium]|nr:hypothetical protein [Deltaproteobacteria bacterium]
MPQHSRKALTRSRREFRIWPSHSGSFTFLPSRLTVAWRVQPETWSLGLPSRER